MVRLLKSIQFARLLAGQKSLLPADFHRTAPFGVRLVHRLLTFGVPQFSSQITQQETQSRATFSHRLQALGPSYIKLGQSLATRPDIIGTELAQDLHYLQDQLPPFDDAQARAILDEQIEDWQSQFASFGAVIAAASIAQVHKATLKDGTEVAVKLLRPHIERQMAAELKTFFFIARMIERFVPSARRIRPVAAIQTLADSVKAELDLRLEAAALSEMGENIKNDDGFSVPEVIWPATNRRVLTMHWVDGIKISDIEGLKKAGHNLPLLAQNLLQGFLTHALRDGFFHGDMHQGNVLVDAKGQLIAIDLGIMGRLDKAHRRFLADTLLGFITRDYQKIADVHFKAGYVSDDKNRHDFAQALRAIGEPISGQDAANISMARLLAQLFDVTAQFDMPTQPQLLLLQKTMVVVEGVARSIDPQLNMWTTAEPVIRDWLEADLCPQARLQEVADNLQRAAEGFIQLPRTLAQVSHTQKKLEARLDKGDISARTKKRWLLWGVMAGIAGALFILWQ